MRIEAIRRGLTARMRERRGEIEQATLVRVRSIPDPAERPGTEYTDALPAVVAAALDYGIEALERSEDNPAPIPTALLSQARLAARHGVKLETVHRRYLAGYTLLGDFLIEESERGGPLDGASLKRLLRVQAAVLDRLIAAVSEEYEREAKAKPGSAEQRLSKLVEQLLEGRRLDTSGLPYEFEAIHVGLVARGPDAEAAVRELARPFDRRLLLVARGEETVWAWLGGKRALDPEELKCTLSSNSPPDLRLTVGEPAEGLGGWRFSHRQAKAAMPIALRSPGPVVRYADVALLASVLQDELLATSLRQIYLKPLEAERDGGEVARETLRAYFACGRNVTSASAVLGVSRRTVTSRMRAIEERLECSFEGATAEIEAALLLHDLEKCPPPPLATWEAFPG